MENNFESKLKTSLIKLPTSTGFDILKPEDVTYLKSNGNYTDIVYLQNNLLKKTTSSKTLKFFEDCLQSDLFFRVHDSYIVNLTFIKQYIKGEGGTIVLQDGTEIDVSRRRKQNFLNLFSD